MAATPGTVEPHAQPRRSFVYRKLLDMGAHFAPINGGSVAMSFGDDVEDEARLARRLGIADLSPLPRTGFKGTGSVDWLQSQDVTIGPESNRGYRQAGGETALRLAPSEILLIDSLAGSGNFISKLNAAWSWGTSSTRRRCSPRSVASTFAPASSRRAASRKPPSPR